MIVVQYVTCSEPAGQPKGDKQEETISRARHKEGGSLCDDSLMSIMRSSHKQHVGLLPDDVSRGPKLSKSSSCVLIHLASLIPINPSQATT